MEEQHGDIISRHGFNGEQPSYLHQQQASLSGGGAHCCYEQYSSQANSDHYISMNEQQTLPQSFPGSNQFSAGVTAFNPGGESDERVRRLDQERQQMRQKQQQLMQMVRSFLRSN